LREQHRVHEHRLAGRDDGTGCELHLIAGGEVEEGKHFGVFVEVQSDSRVLVFLKVEPVDTNERLCCDDRTGGGVEETNLGVEQPDGAALAFTE
jgi:hypothetical protein